MNPPVPDQLVLKIGRFIEFSASGLAAIIIFAVIVLTVVISRLPAARRRSEDEPAPPVHVPVPTEPAISPPVRSKRPQIGKPAQLSPQKRRSG